ncbi:MAG TPA: glutamate-5-semialdehyde dehydrogenase, partial [Stellaceae bacterium]|nr:glutamate-5-semialdehyde dehydrogenase [Stellaceae bacterium]
MQGLGQAARAAAATLARASADQRTDALNHAAGAIRAARGTVVEANRRDLQSAHDKQLSPAMIDRLMLDDERIEAMASGLAEVASLPDPVGTVLASWTRPNGLKIERVRVPLGVIGIIYESRPNVTADAGGLCIRSGNAAILRGGSESFHSSRAIVAAIETGLERAKLPRAAVQLVPTTDRAAVGHMLAMNDLIDVIVPRGGRSLIERVQTESRLPVIAHLEGVCHVYLDRAADPVKARKIVLNAKMRRTGVCGAAETLLVDRAVAATLLPPILSDLHGAGCEIRGDEAVRALDRAAKNATEQDWYAEYLDAILAVKVVDGLDAAIRHVNHYGSHHTDAIVTEEKAAAEKFLTEVDSAIVLVNASTQFAD